MKDGYREALKDDLSLSVFLRSMKDFDQSFCDMIMGRKDFTLRLEVRGAAGKLLHCRVSRDYFERPTDKPGNSNGDWENS